MHQQHLKRCESQVEAPTAVKEETETVPGKEKFSPPGKVETKVAV